MTEYSRMTAGIDVGDKLCEICVLDDQGEVVERMKITSTAHSLTKYFSKYKSIVVAMESGFHSPWMSRLLKEIGHDVIVANSRRVALISQNDNKSDRVDAELLARLARSDKKLLHPIEHRSVEQQKHMSVVRARDALVRSRTALVNHVRGSVKSFGGRLKSTATNRFHKLEGGIPKELVPALSPVMSLIEELNKKIASLEKEITKLGEESYPLTKILREIPGVGPVTALVFILAICDPSRFKHNRDVGPYLGLVPRKRQSGDNDPQLRITRAGNVYLRRLLVNAAHYILGPFGPDSNLRRYGFAIAARGGKLAKKKAAVAVARKLAVLMLAMWKNPAQEYELLREAPGSTRRRPDKQYASCNGASSGRDISNNVALPAARSAAGC